MPELYNKGPEERYPRPISIQTVNEMLAAIPRVITGDGVQMKRIGDRFIIDNTPDFLQPSPQIQNFVVMSEQADYLTCLVFDFAMLESGYDADLGVTLQALGLTGTTIYVAKPYYFQQTPFDGRIVTLNSVPTTFTYVSPGKRIASPGGNQSVTPSYFTGEVIAAYSGSTGIWVGETPISWTDLNTTARVWSSLAGGQCFIGVALTAIPAQSGGVAGVGPVMFYTYDASDNIVSTGVSGLVRNYCTEIAVKSLVSIAKDSYSGKLTATNPCSFTDPVIEPPCFTGCSVLDTYCVSAVGTVASACGGSCSFFSNGVTLTRLTGVCRWFWRLGHNICTLAFDEAEPFVIMDILPGGITLSFNVFVPGGASLVMALYSGFAIWDCSEDFVLTLDTPFGADSTVCINWPATVILRSGACPDCSGLTVSFNDTDLSITSGTFQTAGTGFDGSVPANNLIVLNLGATAHCIAATTTLATWQFDTPPTSTGALTGVVQVGGCYSGDAVQIAQVIGHAVTCDTATLLPLDTTTTVYADSPGSSAWFKWPLADGMCGRVITSSSSTVSTSVYNGPCPGVLVHTSSAPECLDVTGNADGYIYAQVVFSAAGNVMITAHSGNKCNDDPCGGGDGGSCETAIVGTMDVLLNHTFPDLSTTWIKVAKTPSTNFSVTVVKLSGSDPDIRYFDGDDCDTFTHTDDTTGAGCVDEIGLAGGFVWLRVSNTLGVCELDITVSTAPC